MAERNAATWLRAVFGLVAATTLVVCLIGIGFTGPVVVRTRPPGFEAAVSTARLRQVVETLCGEFAPRDWRHTANLDRAAEWIGEQLARAGLHVEIQEYELPEGRFRNVVASRTGTDPAVGAIVFGAHYDTFEGSPGADDNASGVAALLELAATAPQRAARATRYFVAFSSHEPPFLGTERMGSHHFARDLVARGVKVDLMLALDGIGHYSDAPGSQRFPVPGVGLFYPSRGDFAAVVGDAGAGRWIHRVKQSMLSTEQIPVYSFRAPAWIAPAQRSDHTAFRELGLPGVLVTDTAGLRNPRYHSAEDTPDGLDYERMARLVRALHAVLWDPRSPDRPPA